MATPWENQDAPAEPAAPPPMQVSTTSVAKAEAAPRGLPSDPKVGPERHRPRNVGIDGNDDWKKVPGVFLSENTPSNAEVLAHNKKMRKLENDERVAKQQKLKDYIDKFEG